MLGLAIRFWALGLARNYRWFVVYLILSVVRTSLLVPFNFGSAEYLQVWLFGEFFLTISRILAIAECVRLMEDMFPQIGRWGSWTVSTSLVLAIGISVLSAPVAGEPWSRLARVTYSSRGLVITMMLVFLGVANVGFRLWRMSISHNVRWHLNLMMVYLGIILATQWAVTATNKAWLSVVAQINGVSSIATIACFVAWTVLMRRSGEFVPFTIRPAAEQDADQQRMSEIETLLTEFRHESKRRG